MVAVTTFGCRKFAAEIRLLACTYCQKQLKMKTTIKNHIIFIQKFLFYSKKVVPKNKASLLK